MKNIRIKAVNFLSGAAISGPNFESETNFVSLSSVLSAIRDNFIGLLVLTGIFLILLDLVPAVMGRIKRRKIAGYKIVLLRHGESVWNKENRFTGWTDIELSPEGIKEAEEAGKILKKAKYSFDRVYTSILKRATQTTDIVLEGMGSPVTGKIYVWQLNERHYGALQGLNKAEMVQKYGEEQVHLWRRRYDVKPPAMDDAEFIRQNGQEIFEGIPKDKMPRTESLADTYVRAVGYWNSDIVPAITGGKKILVSAHGNSLRAIVKYLDNIGDDEISELNIPTGVPLVYELDENLKPIKHYYLGDKDEIEAKINKVKNQGKGGATIAPKI